jgi:hypothetical protein
MRFMKTIVLLCIATALAPAATVNIDGFLADPFFELGDQGDGCPIDWGCSGSPTPGFSSYTVTSAQYTPGSDGLVNAIVPIGTDAATSPTWVEGSGDLFQTTPLTYDFTDGDTYTFNLWIGVPLTLPNDNVTPTAQPGTIRVYFTGNAGAAVSATDATIPMPGQWMLESFSFTPDASEDGEPVGIDIFLDSDPTSGGSGNNRVGNFDVAGNTEKLKFSDSPEPDALVLAGLGCVLMLLSLRRMKAR